MRVEGQELTPLPFTQMERILHSVQQTSPKLSAWFSSLDPRQQAIEGAKPHAWVLRPLAKEVGVETDIDWNISREALGLATSLWEAGEERGRQWFIQRFLAPGGSSAFTPLE